jgi:nitrogen fixation/metabolism regulation signal transduction histidine kinase
MKWFVNISTKGKLFVGFGVMIVLIMIVSITANMSMAGLHNNLVKLFEVEVPLSLEIVKSRNAMSMERMILSRMIETEKKSELDALYGDLKENDKEIQEKLNMIMKFGSGNQKYIELIDQLSVKRTEFLKSRDTYTIPLIYAGKSNEARKYFFGTQFKHYEEMLGIAANLSNMSEQADKILIQSSGQKVKKGFFIFVSVGMIGIIIGIALVSYLTLIIAVPLKQISGIAERIAYGDLSVQVPPMQRTDEVGTLVMSFGMMLESQKTMTREITDAVDVLAENTASQTQADVKSLNIMAQNLKKLVEQYKT